MNGGMEGQADRGKDIWKKLRMDRRTGGRKGRRKDKRTNRPTDGQMSDRRMDGQTG